jgi:arginase
MTILAPFHQAEQLAADDIPVAADVTVAPEGAAAADAWASVVAVCAAIADAVAPVVASGAVPLVFTGDCLATGGVVAGVQRAGVDPGIVWFDAHGDVHTLATSTSGYLGGLSLRVLTGAHPDRYAGPIGLRPVPAARATLVDARDLDPAEAEYLATGAIARIPVAEVSPEQVPAGPFVLHVDVDVIDPGELPGLRFPAPGGPSAESVLAACARLVATGRVAALSVACPWHAAADDAERARRARLVASFAALVAE